MSEANKPAIITFQVHLDEFLFLGNETAITESSDFCDIWDDFFRMGGYEPILPYATAPQPINVWYINDAGQQIYSQGLFVKHVDNTPDGYKLARFPASDFLVITTEWMSTNEEAVGEHGNGRCNRYAESVPMPEGYVRNDHLGITEIEKENADTPEGSRYEVWVPIKRTFDIERS